MTNLDAVQVIESYFETLKKANGENTSIEEISKCVEKMDEFITDGVISNAISVLKESHHSNVKRKIEAQEETSREFTLIITSDDARYRFKGNEVPNLYKHDMQKRVIERVVYRGRTFRINDHVISMNSGDDYTIGSFRIDNYRRIEIRDRDSNRAGLLQLMK